MIHFHNVSKRFGEKVVLNEVSFSIERGYIYGMIGENGYGKTTIINLIMGHKQPNKGTVHLDDIKIEYINDHASLYGDTLEDTVKFYKLADKTFDEEVFLKIISDYNIDYKDSIKGLSKGILRVIRTAFAISTKCDILIIDELLDGLDVKKRDVILKQLFEYKTDEMSILIVDHNLKDIEQILDRVLFVKDNKVNQHNEVMKIYEEFEGLDNFFKN